MYYFEPVLATLCSLAILTLYIMWRVLGSDTATPRKNRGRHYRKALATSDFIIQTASRCRSGEDLHAFNNVICSFHGIDAEVLWNESAGDGH